MNSKKMSFTSLKDENRSLSPEMSITDDPLDQISDLSFERMEKLCELLDHKEVKEKLPSFLNEHEEAEYVLSLDNYFKNHADELSQIESFVEAASVREENDLSESSISDQQDVVEVYDTLEEVEFILSLANQEFSTPKHSQQRRSSNKYLKIPATESRIQHPDMRNITFRKKNLSSSIPRYQTTLNRSISLSPNCRTHVSVSHSPLLSPFQY